MTYPDAIHETFVGTTFPADEDDGALDPEPFRPQLPGDFREGFVTEPPTRPPRFERADARQAPQQQPRQAQPSRLKGAVTGYWRRDARSKFRVIMFGFLAFLGACFVLAALTGNLNNTPTTVTNTTVASLPTATAQTSPPTTIAPKECPAQSTTVLPQGWPIVSAQVWNYYCLHPQVLIDGVRILTARGDLNLCDIWFYARMGTPRFTSQKLETDLAVRDGRRPPRLPNADINDLVFAGPCVEKWYAADSVASDAGMIPTTVKPPAPPPVAPVVTPAPAPAAAPTTVAQGG